jgi:gluconokinase
MVIIVMGASGAGKTTIGRLLADTEGWKFVEGDDLHPRANIEKMTRGEALTDQDRAPWLAAVKRVAADAIESGQSAVIACSALKREYRDMLTDGLSGITFVYLKADRALLEKRLANRKGHFAGPTLVASQLSTLEEPGDSALTVDAAQPPDVIVRQVREALAL